MTKDLPTPDRPLRIGTRGSPLALAQAHETRDRLAAAFDLDLGAFEIVVIRTTGDDRALIATDTPLKELGGKGLFTREIEEALLSGGIDIAVHSMKDMPVLQPAGLVLDTYLPREDVRDAFVSPVADGLAALPEGARGGYLVAQAAGAGAGRLAASAGGGIPRQRPDPPAQAGRGRRGLHISGDGRAQPAGAH